MTIQDSLVGNTASTETKQVPDSLSNSLSSDSLVDQSHALRDSVAIALNTYFAQLDGQTVTDIYQMVLSEVEAPLLEAVLQYTRNNQTKASILLGLNRGTLRKKLKQHGLLT